MDKRFYIKVIIFKYILSKIPVFKNSICLSLEQLECLNKTRVDTSHCIKSCSGLIITTLAKSEQKINWMDFFPKTIVNDYSKYKRDTGYPSGKEGMYKILGFRQKYIVM